MTDDEMMALVVLVANAEQTATATRDDLAQVIWIAIFLEGKEKLASGPLSAFIEFAESAARAYLEQERQDYRNFMGYS